MRLEGQDQFRRQVYKMVSFVTHRSLISLFFVPSETDSDCEAERLYFGRTKHPHCKTCVCPQEVSVKSKVVVKARPRKICRSPPPLAKKCCCACHCPLEESGWLTKEEVRTSHHESKPSPTRVERRVHSDHKYTLLENWFKRFDFDGNGFIDLFELKTMLNFLGVGVGEEYCRRLLDRADRDRDGRLTFPEFLLMWREAHDEDELIEVIREHDLYPDVIKIDYFRRQPPETQVTETVKRSYGRNHRHIIDESVEASCGRHHHIGASVDASCGRHHRHCSCGCEQTTTRTYLKSPKEESVEYKKKVSRRSTERFPIFSCYR
ncbi:unnamed protein product [Larinioides sclopetarius]|uniref:EF-hand domain-containing protein n=1 Tax=Larinioides sclopetarius TaxID=280406 RepID=A0AAV2B1R0_9ARAC